MQVSWRSSVCDGLQWNCGEDGTFEWGSKSWELCIRAKAEMSWLLAGCRSHTLAKCHLSRISSHSVGYSHKGKCSESLMHISSSPAGLISQLPLFFWSRNSPEASSRKCKKHHRLPLDTESSVYEPLSFLWFRCSIFLPLQIASDWVWHVWALALIWSSHCFVDMFNTFLGICQFRCLNIFQWIDLWTDSLASTGSDLIYKTLFTQKKANRIYSVLNSRLANCELALQSIALFCICWVLGEVLKPGCNNLNHRV